LSIVVEASIAFAAKRLVVEAIFAVRLVMVVVASVEVPLTVRDDVATKLPVVKVLIVALTALSTDVYKLVLVAFEATILVTRALISVVVPSTASDPDVVALPFAATVKLVFSVHDDPFQYSVELVAVPFATVPDTVVQNVDVPFVASTCPAVPVALFESRSSPVRRRAEMVVVARVERRDTVRVEIVVVARVEVP
jgi:hypothetical protein